MLPFLSKIFYITALFRKQPKKTDEVEKTSSFKRNRAKILSETQDKSLNQKIIKLPRKSSRKEQGEKILQTFLQSKTNYVISSKFQDGAKKI